MKDKYEIEYSYILTVPEVEMDIIHLIKSDINGIICQSFTIDDYYYDTEDRLLQRNKYVFRKREVSNGATPKYTLKGPTINNKKLELESYNIVELLKELKKRLNIKGIILNMIQHRNTWRSEWPSSKEDGGFSLFIDKVTYDNGAKYTNVELECNDESKLSIMDRFGSILESKIGIHRWNISKFQMGEIVKELGLTGELKTSDFTNILKYIGDKSHD